VRRRGETPPAKWPLKRKRKYLDWAERVAAGCRGVNPALEGAFDKALHRAREVLAA
jgi:hypothetical protein